jgi:hypothetical protein
MKLFAAALVMFASAAKQSLEREDPLRQKRMKAVNKMVAEEMLAENSTKDHCETVKFCKDFRDSMRRGENVPGPTPTPSPYVASNATISAKNTLTATLSNAQPNDYVAASLNLEMTFYTNGMAQVVMS